MRMTTPQSLKNETGFPLALCKAAIDYAYTHPGCTPVAFLKAKAFAVKTDCSFDDRVKMFSESETADTTKSE